VIIPIRCFTCGKPVAQDWEKFKEMTDDGKHKKNAKDALDELSYTRVCCRRMFLSNVELIDTISKFKNFKK